MDAIHKAKLQNADLIIDRVYAGGRNGNASDDPLPPLVGVSNQGGFRYIGNKEKPRLIVLTSTLRDLDWPDNLDRQSGTFTYFGDNKSPGNELHKTKRFGNLLLRDLFDRLHRSGARAEVPPVLIFANVYRSWRDVQFLGLAVPGVENLDPNSDLVAVWRSKDGQRFQNYQSKFTMLNEGVISRQWLKEVSAGNSLGINAPPSWRRWVEKGVYDALKAPRVLNHRTKSEQLPDTDEGRAIIQMVRQHFVDDEYRFEQCAAKLAELMLPRIVSLDLTRPSRDGGRDGIGKYQLGDGASAVDVSFALEAKCYGLTNSVGVSELSRLISRLRHRQFGVLVTTSYVADQAYKEIKEDEHPIIVICAADIVRLLKAAGIATAHDPLEWLAAF